MLRLKTGFKKSPKSGNSQSSKITILNESTENGKTIVTRADAKNRLFRD
jgi:predicted oxidoreductase (fatty acid repression mutant protein)